MKLSTAILLLGFLSTTVSCAHKNISTEDNLKKITTVNEKTKIQKEDNKLLVYTCLVGKDKRIVTLDKHEKRCEVQYTKFGDEQKVAWAESTPSICDQAFKSIRSNIEESGYKCKEGLDIKKESENKKPLETASAGIK